MPEIVVCIGSNVVNATHNVGDALKWLSSIFSPARHTEPYVTAPEGDNAGVANYTNAVFIGHTTLQAGTITDMFKAYERKHGRTPAHKAQSHIIIDIDLVCYDGSTLNPDEFASDYFTAGYKQLFRQ